MSRSVRFRPHPGAVIAWVGAHAVLWTVVGLATGVVGFLDSHRAILFGAWIGLSHAVLQWVTTSVVIVDGVLVSRNFGWVRRVRVDDIEVVQRVRHRRWSGVTVRMRDGEEIVLAAPLSSVVAPNPDFEDDVHRLCAGLAMGSSRG